MKRHLRKYLRIIQNYFLLIFLTITAGILLISLIVFQKSPPEISFDTIETPTANTAAHKVPHSEPVTLEWEENQTDQKAKQPLMLHLPLSLISTGARDKNSPYAVIRDDTNGKEILVRIGDTILNATITEIDEKKVRLRLDLAEQILTLTETAPYPAEAESQEKNTPPYSPEEIARRYNYDEDIKEVMSMMVQIEVVPEANTSESTGVVITRIQKDSVFERIGLEVNDTILSIDEKKIESVDDSFEIYETLRTSQEGSILIKRNNQQEKLTYHRDYL